MPSEKPKEFNLKERLQRVELALLSSDLEKAESIYDEVLQNWARYEETLRERKKEAEECLALVEHIGKVLEEKRAEVIRCLETAKARKAYVLRSIK